MDTRARIHRLWDELTDFGAARVEDAMLHSLRELAELLGAQQAFWLGSVRLSQDADDPARGWRPAGIRFLHPREEHQRNYNEHKKRIEKGRVDPSIAANVARAGTFRVNIKTEMIEPDWFESEFYKTFFEVYGLRDVIYLVTPIGEDIESWFCFERMDEQSVPFGPAERALLETAGRPLKWLHHQIALHHGLLLAATPLTPSERRLLVQLLGAGSEVDIAVELGLTPDTVHVYATRIYRKFNAKGRAGLMALWLGR
jgi:DNA-binding CsgD family transcriptional regulator